MMKSGKLGVRSPRLTRRQVLRTAAMGAVAAAGFASPAVAQQRNISFTLPWVPEGPNLNSFVAKANGYWSKAPFWRVLLFVELFVAGLGDEKWLHRRMIWVPQCSMENRMFEAIFEGHQTPFS